MNAIEQCPVLHPTAQEFTNFYEYMEAIDKKYSAQYGMVKVVPPKCFKARSQGYQKNMESLVIQGPIEQNVYGKGGVYECLHVQKKSMPLKDYRKRSLSSDAQLKGKSPEQVEDMFWKTLSFSPPLYGADIKISLMDTESQWNFNNLRSVLTEGLQRKISGVNEPYIYVGSWKTFFAWHKEDLDLYATNYLHHGQPKLSNHSYPRFWYSIRQADSQYLEAYAKELFCEHFNKCSEHLRHKTTLINPYLVKQRYPQIQISKTQHNENEFIFVFGGAYHTGFNWGFNIAEAVNYATLNWLDLMLKAKPCQCVGDSVKINVLEFASTLNKSNLKLNPTVRQFIDKIKTLPTVPTMLRKPIRKLKQPKPAASKGQTKVRLSPTGPKLKRMNIVLHQKKTAIR